MFRLYASSYALHSVFTPHINQTKLLPVLVYIHGCVVLVFNVDGRHVTLALQAVDMSSGTPQASMEIISLTNLVKISLLSSRSTAWDFLGSCLAKL